MVASRRSSALLVALLPLLLAWPSEAGAIPYFARRHGVACSRCHTVVPKLNPTGLDFRARGYVLPGYDVQRTIPVATWIAGRYETRPDADVDSTFVDKVEFISGGPIGERASFFVEWRAVSLGLLDDGTLNDRSGRFEDAFVNLLLADHLTLTAGQFRHFNQFDVSLRLPASTPLALGAGVPGERQPGDDAREASLRGFSPAGRSPSLMLTWHRPPNRPGARLADGWYLHAAVPFPGEFSLPLTEEARARASFEFDTRAKGVVLEAYYRKGLSSFGGHAFLGRDSQLYTGMISYDPGSWNTTLAAAAGVTDGDSDRRLSWWTEVQPRAGVNIGFRLDESSFAPTAYHLYADLQLASRRGLLWLLLEQRFRDASDRTTIQLNAVF